MGTQLISSLRIFRLLPILLLVINFLHAQSGTCGLYISRKNFTFSPNLTPDVCQFIQVNADGREIEDIRSEALVYLGAILAERMPAFFGYDSMAFINEQPGLAGTFIPAYDLGANTLKPLPSAFGSEVCVLHDLTLTEYSKTIMISRSNKLLPVKKNLIKASAKLTWFNVSTGMQSRTTQVCVFEDQPAGIPVLLDVQAARSRIGSVLSRLFSLGVHAMLNELKEVCPDQQP